MLGKGPISNPQRRAVCHNRCAIENICIKPFKGFDDGKICICNAKKEKDEPKKNIRFQKFITFTTEKTTDNTQIQNLQNIWKIEF